MLLPPNDGLQPTISHFTRSYEAHSIGPKPLVCACCYWCKADMVPDLAEGVTIDDLGKSIGEMAEQPR
ncbi:hypothetical protein [Neomesorhizobium albiziae]|uniref:hypothetical protein n=1 Tax=Neomesorhizobium albiziae TaxID=335020 RepID=UPI00122CE45E|nr:hypothetical protein [Mesorhizobium albiziae]GLS30728.1 hypothetical protein GCM10007937_24360 [Mesorhizobium albiziae]